MQSLRDKLMKAGLVSEEQARKAEEERKQRAERPRPERGGPSGSGGHPGASARPPGRPPRHEPSERGGPRRPAAPAETRIPKLPPLPGSREHQRLISKRQLELDRQIRETVRAAEVPVEPGATVFYFLTRKNRLRRLELTETQAKQLESGELAVVERPEPSGIEHSLVPAKTAVELLALSERAVRFLNRGDKPIGFMSDDELAHQQDREAKGEAEAEEQASDQAEAARQAAAEAGADGEASATPSATAGAESDPSAPSPDSGPQPPRS